MNPIALLVLVGGGIYLLNQQSGGQLLSGLFPTRPRIATGIDPRTGYPYGYPSGQPSPVGTDGGGSTNPIGQIIGGVTTALGTIFSRGTTSGNVTTTPTGIAGPAGPSAGPYAPPRTAPNSMIVPSTEQFPAGYVEVPLPPMNDLGFDNPYLSPQVLYDFGFPTEFDVIQPPPLNLTFEQPTNVGFDPTFGGAATGF